MLNIYQDSIVYAHRGSPRDSNTHALRIKKTQDEDRMKTAIHGKRRF